MFAYSLRTYIINPSGTGVCILIHMCFCVCVCMCVTWEAVSNFIVSIKVANCSRTIYSDICVFSRYSHVYESGSGLSYMKPLQIFLGFLSVNMLWFLLDKGVDMELIYVKTYTYIESGQWYSQVVVKTDTTVNRMPEFPWSHISMELTVVLFNQSHYLKCDFPVYFPKTDYAENLMHISAYRQVFTLIHTVHFKLILLNHASEVSKLFATWESYLLKQLYVYIVGIFKMDSIM